MTKTHNRNLPSPDQQLFSQFENKLRKIAEGADERMLPEEMTSLLPHVGANLMTKAYLANPKRFIASIDTSVITFLPDVVVANIRGRVFELHTMPADGGDIFAFPARDMNKDQLCTATRLLLDRCKILQAACKQMRREAALAQPRYADARKVKVPRLKRDLLSIEPRDMKRRELACAARRLQEGCQALHAAYEEMKGDADLSVQSAEERRHAGSSTLTAVRLWPFVSRQLANNSKQARDRFIHISTAYKVLAANEYSVIGQAEATKLDTLASLLKRGDRQRALKLLSDLNSSDHEGRLALVRLHVYMRRRGQAGEHFLEALRDALKKTQLSGADLETMSMASASASLIASHTRNNRRGAQGNPAKYARLRLFKCLAMFWRRYGPAPARNASEKYINFLAHLNDCLRSEIKAREISGHNCLLLDDRKAITAALSSLKTKKNNTLVRNRCRQPISGRSTRSHPG